MAITATLTLVLLHQIKTELPTSSYLFFENFDQRQPEIPWFNQDLVVKAKNSRNEPDNNILEQSYTPNKTGTPFIGKRFKLAHEVTEASLSFDVTFGNGFQFVKGGKMHGLSGGNSTTGCKAIDPDGWSVRMMWREEGKPVLYVYHQDRLSRCGDDFVAKENFNFEKGNSYKIDIYIKMNSDTRERDGTVALYINGMLAVHQESLMLSKNRNIKIDSFLYSSFYGGNDPSWSPDSSTVAYFDNFVVREGHHVSDESINY